MSVLAEGTAGTTWGPYASSVDDPLALLINATSLFCRAVSRPGQCHRAPEGQLINTDCRVADRPRPRRAGDRSSRPCARSDLPLEAWRPSSC